MPLLFANFVDMIVHMAKTINVGCYIICSCCSISLYADDILLLGPTISGLRALLSTRKNYFNDVDMCVNAKNHSAFSLDVDIILTALYLPLSPLGSSIGLIAVDN